MEEEEEVRHLKEMSDRNGRNTDENAQTRVNDSFLIRPTSAIGHTHETALGNLSDRKHALAT